MSQPSKFSTLALPQGMIDNLDKMGYKDMTPIQAEALPFVIEGRDVLAKAQTGSGKTAAFGIGILTKLNQRNFG